MDQIRKVYEKLGDIIVQVVYWASGIAVFLFTLIVVYQVFARNVLKLSIIWANDLILIFYVWAAFFGAAVAVRHKEHYVVEIFPRNKFPLLNHILDLLGDIAGLIVFYVLIRYGFGFVKMGMKRFSDSMRIPMGYFYSCIPLSSIFGTYFTIGHIIEDTKSLIRYLKGDRSHEETEQHFEIGGAE